MRAKPKVALGFLGTMLDQGRGSARWERWRPTVSLCQHEDLLIHRLELLYDRNHAALAETIRADVAAVSPETEVRAHVVDIADPWDFETVYGALHDFARAYAFAAEREDYLVHITTGTHVEQICLFLLTESRYFPARLVQTSPPRKDSASPGSYTVVDLDLSKYDRLAARFLREQREGLSFLKAGIDTRNAAFNHMIEQIERVAIASRAPLLLTGPTGAGKSQLARRIYELKRARQKVEGAFVEVNCATVRGDGAMSALFGHVRGAFTGAIKDRPGLLRKADGGLLFLDEIGELGLDEQAMLLRALEDKTFLPVGSDREHRSDFQLLAGTNRDLRARVAEGRFREDLLARINLWTFCLPSLADRIEDIAPNLEFELEKAAQVLATRVTFNREAREHFLAFATSPAARWPGNFRDFNAAVMRMATLAPGGRIDTHTVDEEVARLRAAWSRDAAERGEELVRDFLGASRAAQLDRFERVQLADVLRVCRRSPSLSAAGRELFASSRAQKQSTNDADRLRKYLARYELTWGRLHPKPESHE
jgi:transcriptional regulatory protein RtcR